MSARGGRTGAPFRLVPGPLREPEEVRLDEAQQRVADRVAAAGHGPLLVLAGPGTGKTTTLVEAVAARVEAGTPPDRILDADVLPTGRPGAPRPDRSPAGPHGRGAVGLDLPRLLPTPSPARPARPRTRGVRCGCCPGPSRTSWCASCSPASRAERAARELARRARVRSRPPEGSPTRCAPCWPGRGSSGLEPADLARLRRRGGPPRLAGGRRRSSTSTSTSSTSSGVARLRRAGPPRGAARRAAPGRGGARGRRYDAVFVDEYQDTDPAQERLLAAIAGDGRDLVVVGDPDQSIYSLPRRRGARASSTSATRFPHRRGAPGRGRWPCGPPGGPAPTCWPPPGRWPGGCRWPEAAWPTPCASTETWSPARVARRAPSRCAPTPRRRRRARRRRRRAAPRPPRGRPALGRDGGAGALRRPVAALPAPRARVPPASPSRSPVRRAAAGSRAGRRAAAAGAAGGRRAGHCSPRRPRRPAAQPARRHGGRPACAASAGSCATRSGRRSPDGSRGRARSSSARRSPSPSGSWRSTTPSSERPPASRPCSAGPGRCRPTAGGRRRAVGAVGRHALAPPARARRLGRRSRRAAARTATSTPSSRCSRPPPGSRTAPSGAVRRTFLEELEAQQIPADTLAERALRGDAVRVLTAHRSKGLEWDLVVVAGVQEGVWPDLRRRGSLLDAEQLDPDGLAPPAGRRPSCSPRSAGCSTSPSPAPATRLVVTAVDSPEDDGDRPSRFAGRARRRRSRARGRAPPRPLTLTALVAELRATAVDPGVDAALRESGSRTSRAARRRTQPTTGTPLVPRSAPRPLVGPRRPHRP